MGPASLSNANRDGTCPPPFGRMEVRVEHNLCAVWCSRANRFPIAPSLAAANHRAYGQKRRLASALRNLFPDDGYIRLPAAPRFYREGVE